MIHDNGHKDVIIKPGPAAISAVSKGVHRSHLLDEPSQQEENLILKAELHDLGMQLEQARSATQNLALVALCFARTMVENGIMRKGQESVVIPVAMLREMTGYSITLSRPDQSSDMLVRIRERLQAPMGWEPSG